MSGILLSDDLIDTSRITGEARAQGVSLKSARSLEQLHELCLKESPTCVIVNLHHPGLDVSPLLDLMRHELSPMPRVIGFGSHVDAERLKAARAAGCDLVLPRSAFFEQLSGLLKEFV